MGKICLVERLYKSEIEGYRWRGGPWVKLTDRVDEHLNEREMNTVLGRERNYAGLEMLGVGLIKGFPSMVDPI